MLNFEQVERHQLIKCRCVRQLIYQDVCWRFISLWPFQHLISETAFFLKGLPRDISFDNCRVAAFGAMTCRMNRQANSGCRRNMAKNPNL